MSRLSLISFECKTLARLAFEGKLDCRLSRSASAERVACTLLYGLPMIGVPCSTYSGSELAVSRNCSRTMDGDMNVIRGRLAWPLLAFDKCEVGSSVGLLALVASREEIKRIN